MSVNRDRTGHRPGVDRHDSLRDWRIYDGNAAQDPPPVHASEVVVPWYLRRPWWWPFRGVVYVAALVLLALITVWMIWGQSYALAYTAIVGYAAVKIAWWLGG